MKPLQIYTVVPQKHTASFYYRLEVPLYTARDLGLPVRATIDTLDAQVGNDERIRKFCEADVVLLYQPVGDGPIANVRNIQSFIPSKREGEWKWPPTVVVETDDNLFNVSPLNPAFKKLGTRDMDGKEIPHEIDGRPTEIGVMSNGEKKLLWREGNDGFSLLRNRQQLNGYRKLLEMADAITCSTPHVKASLEQEVDPLRVRVFPNLVRFQDYEQVELREDPKRITILWQGGIAHYEDFFPLRQALGNITRKYPEVHWVIWGAQYPWVNELIPPDRYTYKDWCPYQEFKLRLAMIGHDISIAPLQDNKFNRCRSAIKFYESSVLKKPAATLAQKTGPYQDEVLEGETGLLFNSPEEFESQLATLIENTQLRRTLAANAKQWVSDHRDARKEVPKVVAFWEELREARRIEQPHVSDEHWAEIEKEAEEEDQLVEQGAS